MIRITLAPLGAAVALAIAPQALAQDPGEAFSSMSARSIGPAGMSGRVTAIEGIESDPNSYYVGTATGGLWWTEDDGLTFTALWDDQPVPSIGAIAVYQASPEVVWVGSGEANPRNSSSVGNGVYRSLDGGKSWVHLGLEHTEKISRILVHPSDPDTCWHRIRSARKKRRIRHRIRQLPRRSVLLAEDETDLLLFPPFL